MYNVKDVTVLTEDARSETELVLSSAAFVKSPRMARLLGYLCGQYFIGEADKIKEYNIAVDVLGRPPSFDPAEDAIARVEIHRLRRKLKEYYESEGALHKLRITIPTGSYVPSFILADSPRLISSVPVEPVASTMSPAPPAAEPDAAVAPPVRPRPVRTAVLLLAGAVLIVLVTYVALAPRFGAMGDQGAAFASNQPVSLFWPAPQAIPPGDQVRILAGRLQPFTDRLGRVWEADKLYIGGAPYEVAATSIARTNNPGLFLGGRVGNFAYDLPLQPATYELRLYFAETYFGPGNPHEGSEGTRVFHVTANGKRILSEFDIISDAFGANVADIRVFKDIQPASDGRLHLRFISPASLAMVSAIELIPAPPHRINPVRLTAQDRFHTSPNGIEWMPDTYFLGGRQAKANSTVQNTPDPRLFEMERFGHFSYAIPVADGSYDVSLFMAETYWGPDNSGGGGTGSRVFDILCNGVALARSVDVYSKVGSNRPYLLRFRKLKPNAQGKIELTFVPVANFASLYALSVEDTSR